jgi:hypothetical protein
MDTRRIERKPERRSNFKRRYSDADIRLLADMDVVYEDLSEPSYRCRAGGGASEVLHRTLQPVSELPSAVRVRPIETNRRGKRKCVYRHKGYRTPDEKLTSLQGGQKYLQEGITELRLKRRAGRITDIEAVQRMQKAQRALLARCWPGR